MIDLPHVAISIMQPWADLICHGLKDIENRDWRTNFRGPVLIHAGKKLDKDALDDLYALRCPADGLPMPPKLGSTPKLERGGIVGVAEIMDCVSAHPSRWFVGKFGFVIRNAYPLDLIPCKGQLGFFKPELPALTEQSS